MPYTQVGGSTEFFEDYLTFQSDVVPLFSVFKSIVTITKTGTGSNQINIKPKPKKYSEASHSPASTPIPSPPVRKHLYIFFKGIFCVSTHLSTLETSPFSGLKKKNASRRHLLEPVGQYYIIKINIHSSCEIEDFVETHLCKLCVIHRSRALRVVCPH